MTTLNDVNQIKNLDKDKMADFIADLPKQCLVAYQEAKKIKIPENWKEIKNIIIAGMGGSAIGGDIVRVLTNKQLKIPIVNIRDWHLPNFVNEKSLVIVVSYSGKTKETLNCLKEAEEKNAKVFVISSNQNLKKEAGFIFDFKCQPRAAIGYLSIPILVFLEKIGFIKLDDFEIEKSLEALKSYGKQFLPDIETEKNLAKYIAYYFFEHIPLIISTPQYSPVARRWKTQMNENGKNFSFWGEIPEIYHNTIEGCLPKRLKDEFFILILEDPQNPPEYKKPLQTFEKHLNKEDIRWESISPLGNNQFLKTMSFILLGDWISFYLAMLNNVNPTPVKKIKWFKKEIS